MTNWRPDPTLLSRPAYLSLAEQFARGIESGALAAGARLPPHRKLADELGLSVQTVSRSYEELIRRGLVTGEVGRGSFVLGPGQEARQPYLPERPGEVIDLSILKPAVGAIHVAKMRDGFAWLAENLSASAALSFRPNTVMPHHRAVAADWLARGGISADPSGIAITNGATPAITAALMSLVPPGSALAAEALTHHMLMPLCGYLGIHLEGVAIDDQGMLPDALNEIARKGLIRCVYLQPSVINPLGSMMGLERREALVEVARRHDLAIVENDILNALIADRPPPIAALAPERTLHINGFTKITVPGLRLAYLAAPARYATAVANRHLVAHWMATPPMVELLDHWIGDGTVDELIAIQRAALAERHAICRAILPKVSQDLHPQSLHLWLRLPEEWSEDAFVAQARQRGVALAAGSAFRATEKGRHEAVRISLGSTSPEELRRGLLTVSAVLRQEPEVLLPAI